MASYVKYIESAGARIVPIINEESDENIKSKVDRVNGVLFPGGGGDYLETGRKVFEQVLKKNDDGQLYPAWGICLG